MGRSVSAPSPSSILSSVVPTLEPEAPRPYELLQLEDDEQDGADLELRRRSKFCSASCRTSGIAKIGSRTGTTGDVLIDVGAEPASKRGGSGAYGC